MKGIKILFATVVLTIATSSCIYAGQWQLDSNGWWYDNGNGTWYHNSWHWIESRCYYFTQEGYILTDTTTPDGYTVNGNGEWHINGAVQGIVALNSSDFKGLFSKMTLNDYRQQQNNGNLTYEEVQPWIYYQGELDIFKISDSKISGKYICADANGGIMEIFENIDVTQGKFTINTTFTDEVFETTERIQIEFQLTYTDGEPIVVVRSKMGTAIYRRFAS